MAESYSEIDRGQLAALLEHLHDKYNNPDFIESDPISVPHTFSSRDDREVAGFLAATIAWGNRKAIVKSAHRMMHYMDDAPADFVRGASDAELAPARPVMPSPPACKATCTAHSTAEIL